MALNCISSNHMYVISILILVIFIFNLDFKNGRWPTLLHFAADHGLILFAAELLLHLPFSIDACLTVNIDNETPLQIANRHDFEELTRKIKSCIKIESLKGIFT